MCRYVGLSSTALQVQYIILYNISICAHVCRITRMNGCKSLDYYIARVFQTLNDYSGHMPFVAINQSFLFVSCSRNQVLEAAYRTSLRLGFFLCMYDNCVQVETRVSYHVYENFGRPTPTSNTSTATRRFSSRMSPDKRERYWCPLTGVKTVSKQAPLVTELSTRYL